MKRVASAHSLNGFPCSVGRAVFLNRINRILRASRVIAARGGQEKAFGHLVDVQAEDCDMCDPCPDFTPKLHRLFFLESFLVRSSNPCRIFCRSPPGRRGGDFRSIITTAHPWCGHCSRVWRNVSRIRRRSRFRTQAFPIFLRTLIANRAGEGGSGQKNSRNHPPE